MAESNIEWTDVTWNPVRGCTRVSEGCRNCYAERQAARFSGKGQPYEGLIKIGERLEQRDRADGSTDFTYRPTPPRWTGVVRFVPEKLNEPLSWRKPKRVFVNSMSDLFHDGVSEEEIARIFVTMAKAKRHTFQVLTKRPARMLNWFKLASLVGFDAFNAAAHEMGLDLRAVFPWPLPNVWLGVSVENQKAADERIPLLLQTPAAVRFLSVEPLLGPVDLSKWLWGNRCPDPQCSDSTWDHACELGEQRLHWVIVGGESGPGARPCALEWVQSVVDQCRAAGVAVFVKQLGAFVVSEERAESSLAVGNINRWLWRAGLTNKKGGDPTEWPADLRVREFPEVARGC